MKFDTKKIFADEGTVAETLTLARKEKDYSLQQAAAKISIKAEYLAALENNNYSILPNGVYEKTFLRKYAKLLGLNPERLQEKYLQERGNIQKVDNNIFSKKKVNRIEMLVFPKILKTILIVLIIGFLFLYLGYYLKNTFSPPTVNVFQPKDNLVTTDNFTYVTGQADLKTQISINNKQILKDVDGNFSEKVDLKKGINIILITAQNKYSSKKTVQKQILVQ